MDDAIRIAFKINHACLTPPGLYPFDYRAFGSSAQGDCIPQVFLCRDPSTSKAYASSAQDDCFH